MTEEKPKFSILSPTFNHEKYVKFLIESCLNQTFRDFELILVDDCSSDRNIEEIKKFQDSRIKLIKHEFNKGINATINTAFENAKGEYIVFIAGDDMLKPNALERLYDVHQKNPQAIAIYPLLTMVDNANNEKEQVFVWLNQNRSQEEMLHQIFMSGNCLTSPGMSMSREKFAKILYPLDNAMCVHQDTQMHTKILAAGDIFVLQEALIWYRFDENATNISFPTPVFFTRVQLEVSALLDTFLNITDTELLKKIFAEEIQKSGVEPKEGLIPFFLGRMALYSQDWDRQSWGYRQIMHSYNTPQKAQKLHDTYNFVFKDYLQLALLCVHNDKTRAKYKKYKKLFNITLGICVVSLISTISLAIYAL
ncbi:glycosyltransferase family 2 protein [Helicobacter sp. MIT 05-5293]|uniref:glycosyltransferase family 2 protein n=1 Tax=Helicobacter sp. MIT 05-5293 TaxID=1548149 RepID=UPI00051D86AD|nr:glycosyltransferase family A protein [Helicobacter sp. MIT 05-5293]TLD82008.1 glycosyltransferase family 2 protein [Helicobacter sp. MIT 05-5293]